MDAKFICLEDKAFYELIDQVVDKLSAKHNRPINKWIDGKEAMEKLHCKTTKLQELRDTGEIEISKMGNIILYNSFSIDEYIERNKRETLY
ncbi:MAG: helix-turn-helix domain-containing protein [Bacteroidota bacterium]